MTTELSDWLGQVQEEALEPELPICDAHHHLWDRPGNPYLIEDLVSDAAQHNVVSSVFVECMVGYRENGVKELKPVGETEFIERIASEADTDSAIEMACSTAIIGYADLSIGCLVVPVLEAHIDASPGRFRGTRHGVSWDANPEVPVSHTRPMPGLLLDSTFREGFGCLQELGLVFDSYLYHTQLMELVDLAHAFPEQRIILDHFGGPLGVGTYDIKSDQVRDVWRKGICALAECPNVVAKLGGIAMPRNGFGWHERDVPPTSDELAEVTQSFYLHCIDEFGPARCMFESNFPVDKQSCSYTVLWNSFKRIVSDFSDSEKADMFRDVAERVYGIGS